jgi:hypothetical protein
MTIRVTWDIDTIPMKDRVTSTQSSVEALIEVYMSLIQLQPLKDEYC